MPNASQRCRVPRGACGGCECSANRSAFLFYDPVNDDEQFSWFITPVPGVAFNFLVVSFFVYFLWAWYFSQIFTGNESRPQPFYFPFIPSYWIAFKDGGAWGAKLIASLKRNNESMIAGTHSHQGWDSSNGGWAASMGSVSAARALCCTDGGWMISLV